MGYDDISDENQHNSDNSFISTHSGGVRSEWVLKLWSYLALSGLEYEDYINSGFAPQPKSK